VREPITISAKTLGGVAMPNFCPRCFWISMHAQGLPYQIFPGIFSSIDSYSKKVVHGWFDRHGAPPAWLAPLGSITGYVNPPHYSKFRVLDEKNNVVLRGAPDGILRRRDGSWVIVDYKTAKFTANQDLLLPMYAVQLNAYAYIGERCEAKLRLSPVAALALVYTEPLTGDDAAHNDGNADAEGFRLGFGCHIEPIKLEPERIPVLLQTVRKICDLEKPPEGKSGCKDCDLLRDLLRLAGEET
jgi:PD-(D/E)XK nuclease superfamily